MVPRHQAGHHETMHLIPPMQRYYFALAIAIAGTVSACSVCRFQPAPVLQEQSEIALTTAAEPRGAFIVIHGLNQRPTSMNPLSEYLRTLGFHTYRITLRGHDELSESAFTSEEWERDVLNGYATLRSRFPDLPINVVGYSLGGLLATKTLDTYPDFSPNRMVLFAPGLSFRPLVQSGYLLQILPPLTIGLPNLSPTDYKRFQNTPLFWYQNIFTLYTGTRDVTHPRRLRDTPTIVFLNPTDELVSLSGTENWIGDNQLAQSWTVIPVHRTPLQPFMAEHIVIDERSLGFTEWERVKGIIREFVMPPNTKPIGPRSF